MTYVYNFFQRVIPDRNANTHITHTDTLAALNSEWRGAEKYFPIFVFLFYNWKKTVVVSFHAGLNYTLITHTLARKLEYKFK